MTESPKRRGSKGERRPRVTPATVLAGLALFVALGGTSIAASGLINGKQIKPGTITAKQIKNKAITKAKLAPSTVSGLRGAAGPKGDAGPKGERGPAGATGPAGPAALPAAHEDESEGVAIPQYAGVVDLAELELPAGRYMVTAKAVLVPNAATEASCWVTADYGDYVDSSNWSSTGPAQAGTLSLAGLSPAGTEILTLRCYQDDVAGLTGRNKLIAIPVAG